jgi:hypothetical protein
LGFDFGNNDEYKRELNLQIDGKMDRVGDSDTNENSDTKYEAPKSHSNSDSEKNTKELSPEKLKPKVFKKRGRASIDESEKRPKTIQSLDEELQELEKIKELKATKTSSDQEIILDCVYKDIKFVVSISKKEYEIKQGIPLVVSSSSEAVVSAYSKMIKASPDARLYDMINAITTAIFEK